MKHKKKLVIFLVIVLLAAVAGYKFFYSRYTSDMVAERTEEPLLTIYDRNNSVKTNAYSNCKHVTVRLTNENGNGFVNELQKMLPANQSSLITLEIWPSVGNKLSKENVLTLIDKGNFDDKIKALSVFLGTQQQAVLIRLIPDMEVYVNRYPWQMQGATMYNKAFRHIAVALKKDAPAVKIVWAPAGYPGTEEYWPGAQWVDLVSITLKSKSEGLIDHYPEDKTMWQHVFRKLHRLRFFDKPVLIMGSEKVTRQNFQQPDVDSAISYIQQNKEIEYLDVNAADKETDSAALRKNGALVMGVFDPFGKLVDSVSIDAEHVFVNLRMLKSGLFKKVFDSIVARKHKAIVTMEPWRDAQLDKDPLLIDHILSGQYDSVLNEMYAVISTTSNRVYLRWLHEMEIPIKRYPWQSQDPVKYIKAYRYFVNFIRNKKPANIFFVWGPAGDRGSMEFWPGSDVVDYTSVAIYGLPDKNITDPNMQESFSTIFKRKYHRIRFTHKPLFITEFGVKGPPAYKQQWLAAAAETIEANAEITGVSYFNDADNPKAWGDIEAPDWAISAILFNNFRAKLKTAAKQ